MLNGYPPEYARKQLVCNMDTTIFKIHAKTELSLYPTILTSSLDIILINDIIMHMMNYLLQTMQAFAYSET